MTLDKTAFPTQEVITGNLTEQYESPTCLEATGMSILLEINVTTVMSLQKLHPFYCLNSFTKIYIFLI